jgi:hypothetical protein
VLAPDFRAECHHRAAQRSRGPHRRTTARAARHATIIAIGGTMCIRARLAAAAVG